MEEKVFASRPTLARMVEEYKSIEREYVASIASLGVDFASRGYLSAENASVRQRIREKGALFCHGGSSVSIGSRSSACVACATDCGSRTFFLSLACNRSCFFCFNSNQKEYGTAQSVNRNWRHDLETFVSSSPQVSHIALTGGEPLLHSEEALAFFSYAHSIAPQAHLRLYTDGDYLSPSLLLALASSGLSELRLSVKPDEPNAYAEGLKKLALAQEYIPAVMVEMPVLPYMVPEMRDFLKKLDEMSVFGVNLLELGYPFNAWGPFAERGLCLKNPPFAVSYDYSYAGGLPVAGSELACLYLLEFALDEGMEMGVHYCSLENKNRMQIYFQNTQVALSDDVWEFDGDDFFWKTIKLFDGDAADAVSALENLGVPWEEEDEGVLRVHPRHRALLLDLGTVPALSWNVIEESSNGWLIREVALELPDNL